MSGVYSICRACFRSDPTNRDIARECHRHRNEGRIDVVWDDVRNRFVLYQIRPVPDKEIKGRFIMCPLGSRCSKGQRCTYAHTEAEQREWNKLIKSDSAKPVFSRTHSVPMKKKPGPADWRPKPSANHRASFPLGGGGYQPPLQKTPTMAEDKRLTVDNYQTRFFQLIDAEKISHARILEERCDGTFTFVVDREGWMYLLGISGDNIAYVTQASDSFVMWLKNGREIQGEISSENFAHIEEVLYLDVDEAKLQYLNITKVREYEGQVDVKFNLKDRYFISLHRFVESLSRDIIGCLLPSKFPPFRPDPLENCYDALRLQECSDDQRKALASIVASPVGGPPVLVTGPFGTGKTRILAIAAHYFLQHRTRQTSILVCTQQHVSADAFLTCVKSLLISISGKAVVARVTNRPQFQAGKKGGSTYSAGQRCTYSTEEFVLEFTRKPPTQERPYLVITTCQTAHSLKRWLPREFFFSHILVEVAQMREAEAIAPLCLANRETKIVLAGDKQQVGPDLLVLGEIPREGGFSTSLLERLEMHYNKMGGNAAPYIVRLETNYRCHHDILRLAEKLFYKSPLKSVVPPESTHPSAPFPLVFVCSDLTPPQPSENPINELEAKIIIEQLQKFAGGWPKDFWGMKVDPSQICVMSPSRTQVNKIKEMLFKKNTEVPEILKQVEKHPSYDMQGREYRTLFLSTFEATHEDGSTRNPTKSIVDPYVVNTVVSRARSLVVSVGNPYQLLKMEQHMCRRYGEKGKYWSNYIKQCLHHKSLVFHPSTGVYDADKQSQINRLSCEVEKLVATKYHLDASLSTTSSDATPIQRATVDLETEECEIPDNYTGRLEMDFTLGRSLGKGGFAHVYEVTSKLDGGSYALKIVQLPNKRNSHKKVLREVRGLRKLDQPQNHQNIVRYYSSWVDVAPTDDRQKFAPWKDMEDGEALPLNDSDSGTTHSKGDITADTEISSSTNHTSDSAVTKYRRESEDTDSTTTTLPHGQDATVSTQRVPYLFIRTELCGRTLKQWLQGHKTRKRQLLLHFFEQILDAVQYIHRKRLAHRDLKPSNIFQSLGDKHVLKVGDFGLVAGNFGSPEMSSRARSYQVSFSGQVGTPLYMSPEQLEHTRCTEKVDIYALGVIYFEMNYVFQTDHEKLKVMKDLQKGCQIPVTFVEQLPKETTVIQKLMTHDPDCRPTADYILESRWFDELKKTVQKELGHIRKM